MPGMIDRAKNWLMENEKYLSPLAMAAGFSVDYVTLKRIDLLVENLVLIGYLSLAVVCIMVMDAAKPADKPGKLRSWLELITPYVLQFGFGGLFSAFVIFYGRSASWFVSWPFLLVLFSLLLGNEFFRERYRRLIFHLSVLYAALFCYSVFAVPVLVGRIGLDVFLLSGGVSILLIFVVVLILYRIGPQAVAADKNSLVLSILSIYLIINFLYFSNIIPPIPLALTEAGVYHDVSRSGADYRLHYEPAPWYVFWRPESPDYHWQGGERVYIFSSIFAPARFREQIFHRWLQYDEIESRWQERDRLSYALTGGRDQGFRGYSFKQAVSPGKWRVDIITDRGQVLGRVRFRIVADAGERVIEERVR